VSDLSSWCLRHYDALHDFAGPVATVIAASVAVFVTFMLGRRQVAIAAQQANIANQQERHAAVRLQHDLFEKRITVFNAIRDLIIEIARMGDVSDETWYKFVQGVKTTEFLFRQDIVEYIADLRQRALRLQNAAERLRDQNLPDGPGRSTSVQVRADEFTWIVKQSDVLVSKFKPALALE
jgi:hypothetical protein